MLRFIKGLLIILILPGCAGSTIQFLNSDLLPDIEIDCRIGDSSQCSSTSEGKTLWVGFTDLTNVVCEDELSAVNDIPSSFLVHNSSTVSFNGVYTNAEVTSWLNENSTPTQELSGDNITICAFIDFNNNQKLDINEPFSQSLWDKTQSFQIIDEWSTY